MGPSESDRRRGCWPDTGRADDWGVTARSDRQQRSFHGAIHGVSGFLALIRGAALALASNHGGVHSRRVECIVHAMRVEEEEHHWVIVAGEEEEQR